jgi:uncharacterized protein YggL (DUF469 family)
LKVLEILFEIKHAVRVNGLPDASTRCKRFNQLVCRKIMNSRNETRRQTIRALVGTAETDTKSENPNIEFFYNISLNVYFVFLKN